MSNHIILLLITTVGFTKAQFQNAVEIGAHVPGEVLVLEREGFLPDSESLVRINVTHSVPSFQKDYTYFRVNYENSLSPVEVTYNKVRHFVRFMVKVPLEMTRYSIVGYALPEPTTTTKEIIVTDEDEAKATYPEDSDAQYPEYNQEAENPQEEEDLGVLI
ncbi:hypothetical protein O0L34_g897 [Tuta absoluta]|nr:hypothetical protein O0L34_g897 [Tuta absoluta]